MTAVIDGPHPAEGAVGAGAVAGVGPHVHQAFSQGLGAAGADGRAVAAGAFALYGGEQLVGIGVA